MGEPLATDVLRPNERALLEKAVEASRHELRLAELGVAQASKSEVRSHAQQLLTDHRALSEALGALLQRKSGTTRPRPANDAAGEAYQQLAEKTGADFDREFVRAIGARHDELIALFEQAAAEAKDTDLRELAAAQLPMLRGHHNVVIELKKSLD